jgi:hypothetical protein
MKIENIWQDFEEKDAHKTGVVLKRYSPEIIPDCFVAMRMPEKVKSIAFRISTDKVDVSALNDLKDITTEIIPDETDASKSLLLISLSDNSLSSIFAVLCEDLFNSVSSITQESKLILALQNRFLKWKELFMLAKKSRLITRKTNWAIWRIVFVKKVL